jgi:protoheme IX farnesyltransferase
MRHLLALVRIRISLYAAFAASAGYLLSSARPGGDVFFPAAGVLLLASGASALNQYQERDTDALMERTRGRPLPSGSMSPGGALFVSAALILAGLSLLVFPGDLTCFLLGVCALLWYNGLYTWLKKKTAFAVFPGALVGAVPPAIGWTFAGGSLDDPRILAVCFFFFLWQVPHFCLLVLTFGEEYARAGLPSLSDTFSRAQLGRVTFVWLASTSTAALLIPLFGIPLPSVLALGLLGASLWLVLRGLCLLRHEAGPAPARAFNLFAFLVTLILSASPLVNTYL